jgi:outer membrane biosynthesis protein TonB
MRLAPLVLLCAAVTVAVAYPDKSPIRREIRVHMPQFRACYERALVKNPKLEGRVVAKFTIDTNGDVVEASSEGMPEIDACITSVVRTLKFPAGYRKVMQINYPFEFRTR